MAHITEEHLHHMARRHHATMQRLDDIKNRIRDIGQKSFSLLETGLGAWAGGMYQGKFGGQGLGPIPYNLLAGVGLLALGYTNLGGERASEHLNNLGNGLVASYLSAAGLAFGKRWRETGEVFGNFQGRPWTHPYENGWPKGAAAPTAPAATPSSNGTPPPPASAGWYGYGG